MAWYVDSDIFNDTNFDSNSSIVDSTVASITIDDGHTVQREWSFYLAPGGTYTQRRFRERETWSYRYIGLSSATASHMVTWFQNNNQDSNFALVVPDSDAFMSSCGTRRANEADGYEVFAIWDAIGDWQQDTSNIP
jgi:hypothetical protein